MRQIPTLLAATGIAALAVFAGSQASWGERASVEGQPSTRVAFQAAAEPVRTVWTDPPPRVSPALPLTALPPPAPELASAPVPKTIPTAPPKQARLKARTKVAARSTKPSAPRVAADPQPVLVASAETPAMQQPARTGGPVGDILRGLGIAD